MSLKFLGLILIASGVSLTHASEACDRSLTEQYRESARIVESLRADKGGQTRVFASDGSEFTAGQAAWMRGQLREVEAACARGDQARATQLLGEVQKLLKLHRRGS